LPRGGQWLVGHAEEEDPFDVTVLGGIDVDERVHNEHNLQYRAPASHNRDRSSIFYHHIYLANVF